MNDKTRVVAPLGAAGHSVPVAMGDDMHVVSQPNRHRSNGFDLLRIVAAIMVIYGHSGALTGSSVYGILDNKISTIGVKIFFVVSGFLITRSWMSDPCASRFAQRRIVRIVPGLACVSIVTLLFLGPAFTQLPLSIYFTSAGTWRYLWNIAFYPIYDLPGVFVGTKYPLAVNGSLWSLPAEILMYLVTPFIIGRSQAASKIAIVLSAAVFAITGVYYLRIVSLPAPYIVYGSSLSSVIDVAAYFQMGAVYAVFRLERYGRPVLALTMLMVAAWFIQDIAAPAASISEFLLLVLLPFAVVSVGYLHLSWVERPLASVDVSYGMYLYGFPVQQVLMALSHNAYSANEEFMLTLPITFVFALLSWLVVERYALLWKPRRRGS